MAGRDRYVGVSEWYDDYAASSAASSVDAIAALLGRGDGRCLDLGCGTGLYFDALRRTGRDVVGVDASADQLLRAKTRHGAVIQCDAAALPLRDGCCNSVVAIWLSTDVDDFERVLLEAARVLAPGGRMLLYGVHPCFNGPFVEAQPDGSRVVHPGYREAAWHTASPWWSQAGVRNRVGMRHMPLASLINAIAAADLRIVVAEEPRDEPVPVILALLAEKPVN